MRRRTAYENRPFCPQQALEVRLRACIGDGRRVLVVGDLNIKSAPADTCRSMHTDECFYEEHWDR